MTNYFMKRPINTELKNNENDRNKRLATFLKRKRLEQHLTLEEASKGVCTVSYLSRIENSVVNVDETYFIPLFKNLGIDYYTLEESQNSEIFKELLHFYLLRDYKHIKEIINQAIKDKCYVSVEYDLMTLLDNIINNHFHEAKKLISIIEEKDALLESDERTFYNFLCLLFLFKTKQGNIASKSIKHAIDQLNYHDVYFYGIISLALDIFTFTKNTLSFLTLYDLIQDEYFTTTYTDLSLKHQIARYTFENTYFDGYYKDMLSLKMKMKEDLKDEIDYYFVQYLYLSEDKDKFFEFIDHNANNAEVLTTGLLKCLEINDKPHLIKYLELINNETFKLNDLSNDILCETISLIMCDLDYSQAFNKIQYLVKNQIENINEAFIFNLEKQILCQLALKLGKYKDVVLLLSKQNIQFDF